MAKASDGVASVSWAEVCARRQLRQGLTEPLAETSLADVVRAMCGAQAQVMAAAELSVAVRTPAATRREVRAAVWEQRSLVKTHGPRGTIHLLPTNDLPMWVGAFSTIPVGPSPSPAEVRMTPEQTEAVVEAIAEVLRDDDLTVDELSERVVDATGPWAGDLVMPAFQTMWPRWRQAMGVAAQRGALCFGPERGRRVTYASPQRWLPGFHPASGPQAAAELLRHYLRAYGPATAQGFAKWLGAPGRWAQQRFDAIADELDEVRLDGAAAWVLASDADLPLAGPPAGVRLLPYFDAYSIAAQPRGLLFPGRAFERALARGQAGNYPVLLVDGTVRGVWHQRRSGRHIDITVEPIGRLSAGQRRAVEAQAERVGEILEGTARLTFGPVTVGAHA